MVSPFCNPAIAAGLPVQLWLAAALAPAASLALGLRARAASLNLRYLSSMGYRTAVAAAEVMLPASGGGEPFRHTYALVKLDGDWKIVLLVD